MRSREKSPERVPQTILTGTIGVARCSTLQYLFTVANRSSRSAPVPTKKPRVYATLESSEVRLLSALAEERRVTVSWLVRQAVLRLLEDAKAPVQLGLDIRKVRDQTTER